MSSISIQVSQRLYGLQQNGCQEYKEHTISSIRRDRDSDAIVRAFKSKLPMDERS